MAMCITPLACMYTRRPNSCKLNSIWITVYIDVSSGFYLFGRFWTSQCDGLIDENDGIIQCNKRLEWQQSATIDIWRRCFYPQLEVQRTWNSCNYLIIWKWTAVIFAISLQRSRCRSFLYSSLAFATNTWHENIWTENHLTDHKFALIAVHQMGNDHYHATH